jgi:hypothetical protein
MTERETRSTSEQSPAADPSDPLFKLWCMATDAAVSKDFRYRDGSMNEEAYLRYQRNAIAETRERLRVEATEDTQ